MRLSMRPFVFATCLAVGLASAPLTIADNHGEWLGYRTAGPDGALPDSFGLVETWKRELGAGYSSLAVADGLVVAMHTAGDDDVLAAFDAATGADKWQVRFDTKYAAHDGSDDGPLGSPAIADGDVYALGPKGQLIAVELESGKERWRVQLDESNSNVPFYGYTSSPLPLGDLVVILAGGEGRAVTAYDRKTGELRWSKGDDSVTYQSPILADVGGREHLVAVTDQWAYGLDPQSGDTLWSYEHSTGESSEGSAHPTVLDADHLLINLSEEALALRVTSTEGKLSVEEAWRSRIFANSLVLPVVHGGAVFGFTGRILTSAKISDGDFNWRSRGAQAFNLSLIDGHLAMVTRDGNLVVAVAGGSDFAEVARLQVFERGDYANPAFVGDHFFVRNQTHLAAVRVDKDVKAEVAEVVEDPHRYLGEFGAFVKTVEGLAEGERQARVDAHFAEVESTPIVEADGSTHVIYRGAAEDVSLGGNILGFGGDQVPLHRVAGTDLFYRSLPLDPKGSYDYGIGVDFGRPSRDPANAHFVDYGWRQLSELQMPGFRANEAIAEPAEGVARGELNAFRFHSKKLENARQIQIWTPPGFSAEARYPLLVVNHGNNALGAGAMGNVLDHTVGSRVAPVVVAFVPRNSGAEYNGDLAPAYASFLVEELIPHLEQHYQVGEDRAIMGPGSGAVIAVHTAMAFPGSFQKVVGQSFYLTDENRDAYWQMLEGSDAKPTVWLESGPNDYVIEGPGIHAHKSTEALVEKLTARGVDVTMNTVYGRAGWTGWRAQTDAILEALFPADS
ncbi:MAG: PQQ-binding-like beta-propeller repeat protein [Acidobacteriota bacterium]